MSGGVDWCQGVLTGVRGVDWCQGVMTGVRKC